MCDPEKEKMLKNATFILNMITDKSISDIATMESIRDRCLEVMTQDDIEKAAAFLESGEAVDYLRSIADH